MSHSDDVSPSAPAPDTGPTTHDQQALQGPLPLTSEPRPSPRRLFTHAPAPMLLVSPVGRIVDANLQAGQILGLTSEAVLGRPLARFVGPASYSTVTALLGAAFSQPGSQHADLVLTPPDGTPRTVRVHVTQAIQAPEEAEPTLWAHLVLTDVTDLTGSHLQALDPDETLRRQVRDHEARQARLESEVQGVVRATQAQVYLQVSRIQNLLRRHVKAGGLSHHLTLAQEALTGTFTLLASLDRYVQVRHLRLRHRQVDLNRVLREVQADLDLSGRAVEWTGGPLPTVYGDSRALRVILSAYVSNALKFTRTREVAKIRFVTEEYDHEVVIGVQDNGVGYSNRFKHNAFERFVRLHPAAVLGGAGGHLATVRQVCNLMGGRAWAEGEVDQGATFWFACPKPPTAA